MPIRSNVVKRREQSANELEKRKVWADNRLEKLVKSTESPPKTCENSPMNRTRHKDAINRTQEVVQ